MQSELSFVAPLPVGEVLSEFYLHESLTFYTWVTIGCPVSGPGVRAGEPQRRDDVATAAPVVSQRRDDVATAAPVVSQRRDDVATAAPVVSQLVLDLPGADPAISPLSEELDWDRSEWRVIYHVNGHRSSRVIEASGLWAARSELLRIVPGAQILDCRFEG